MGHSKDKEIPNKELLNRVRQLEEEVDRIKRILENIQHEIPTRFIPEYKSDNPMTGAIDAGQCKSDNLKTEVVDVGQTIELAVERPTVFYAPSLNSTVFKLEDRFTSGTTIYKVNTKSKTFVLDDRAIDLILRDKRNYLQYGCQHRGFGDKYELVRKGTIRLNNNNQWEVATPIEIKWKGDN